VASLYKRGKYFWIHLTPNDAKLLERPRAFSTQEKSKEKAKVKLKEIKDSMHVARYHPKRENLHPRGSMYFSEALESYVSQKRKDGVPLDKKSIEIYQRAINRFFISLDDKLVSTYTKEDYSAFVASMDPSEDGTIKGLSQNTKSLYTTKIRTLFNYLVKEDILPKNYFRSVKEEVKEIHILTKTEMDDFLTYAKATKFYPIIKFMQLGALRATEATLVVKEHIKKDYINIVFGKGSKNVVIPKLKDMEIFLENNPAFPSTVYVYDHIRKFCNRASDQPGFKVTSHDMRRYRISELANAGVTPFFLKEYARHSNIETTLKYYAKADMVKMKNEINSKLDITI